MCEQVKRCALIYHTEHKGKKYILVGFTSGKYTSIGGRKQPNESNVMCCAREVAEETKGLIDFTYYPDALNQGKIVYYAGCNFYFVEIDYNVVLKIVQNFTHIRTETKESNELECLKLEEIEFFIENIVYNYVSCKEEFRVFMLDIGFDTISKNTNSIFTEDIKESVKLLRKIEYVPHKVSIIEMVDFESKRFVAISNKPSITCSTMKNLSVVTCSYKLYIEQFFLRREDKFLFRDGFDTL